MQIDWSRVIDFIARRDAALAASFVGVRPNQIDALQVEYGITLPSVYVDFIRTMGENSGELQPFGETQVHTFSELIEQLPPDGYPPKRFFKVAFEGDESSVTFLDIYLDLTRSDGHDAPLVMFETPFEPTDDFREQYLSLVERLVYHIFQKLDVDRKRYGADIVVFGRDSRNGTEVKHAAVDVLTRSGFVAALPDLRRVGCLTRESVSVLISVSDTGNLVELEIGGDSLEATEEPVRDLLAAFPGAELSEPPAERTDEAEA